MDTQTILFILIAVAQVGVLIWYFNSLRMKRKKAAAARDALSRQYPFEGMRHLALNTVPGAVLANVQPDDVIIYSVLMDWDMGTDVVTLAVQITGEANLYVKSGGGIIGAGKYMNVSEAAQRLIGIAQESLVQADVTADIALPQSNYVQFFLLTNRGKFRIMDDMKNLESKQSPALPLFEAANMVLGEMRKTAMSPAQ